MIEILADAHSNALKNRSRVTINDEGMNSLTTISMSRAFNHNNWNIRTTNQKWVRCAHLGSYTYPYHFETRCRAPEMLLSTKIFMQKLFWITVNWYPTHVHTWPLIYVPSSEVHFNAITGIRKLFCCALAVLLSYRAVWHSSKLLRLYFETTKLRHCHTQ